METISGATRVMPVLFLQDPQEESVTLPRAHTSAVLDELQGGGGPHQN